MVKLIPFQEKLQRGAANLQLAYIISAGAFWLKGANTYKSMQKYLEFLRFLVQATRERWPLSIIHLSIPFSQITYRIGPIVGSCDTGLYACAYRMPSSIESY